MKGIREIKGRIKAVKNTAQITRAMQLVAASKMKRAQEATLQGRPYTVLLAEILANIPTVGDIEHPLLTKRPVKNRGVLVVSTDKGLCGALNANLFRLIPQYEEEHGLPKEAYKYLSVGRKAKQFLARSKRQLVADFSVSDKVSFREVRTVVDFMLDAYTKGEIDTIDVIYPRFVNTLMQEPTIAHLAPITDLNAEIEKIRKNFGSNSTAAARDERQMSFEPSPTAILAELPPLFIRHQIYQRILEMKASEQSARMVAMKSATDNANNLVDSLTLEFNKARQAGITQEILELAAATASSK